MKNRHKNLSAHFQNKKKNNFILFYFGLRENRVKYGFSSHLLGGGSLQSESVQKNKKPTFILFSEQRTRTVYKNNLFTHTSQTSRY